MPSDGNGEQVRVAVFVPLFPPARFGGGPIRTLDALTDQQPERFHSLIFTSDRDLGESIRLPVRSNQRIEGSGRDKYYVSVDGLKTLATGYRVVRNYRPSIIYLNGFFTPIFSLVPQLLSALGFFQGAGLVLAPRGEFSPGALAIRSRKKRWFLRLFKGLRLHRRVVWHASSVREMQDIQREFGARAKVLIRENETRLPESAELPDGESRGPLRVIFVSRISEKKGLHRLLESLCGTSGEIELSVFGNVEDVDYFKLCEEIADRLPPSVRYRFRGHLNPDSVRSELVHFDLFAFPTAGENFGHVIAESLSSSCPVMCADNTPWTEIVRSHGGGVLVGSLKADEWAEALDVYSQLSSLERATRRSDAAKAFEKWRQGQKGRHIFELAHDEFASAGNDQ